MNHHQAHLQQYKLRQKTLRKSREKKQQRAQARQLQQAQLLAQQQQHRQALPLVQPPPPPVQAPVLLPPLQLQPHILLQAEETPPRPEDQEPWVPPPIPPKPTGQHRKIIHFQDQRQKFASCSQLFSDRRSLSESFQQDLDLNPDAYQQMFSDRARFSPVLTQSCPNIPVSAAAQAEVSLDFIHSNSQLSMFTPIIPATSQTAESSPVLTVSDQYPESVQLESSSDSDVFVTPPKEDTETSPPTTPTNTTPPPVPLLPDRTKGVESKFKRLAAGTTVLAKAIVKNQKPPPRPPKQQQPPEPPPRHALGREPKTGDLEEPCQLCTQSSNLTNWQDRKNIQHSANCSKFRRPSPPPPVPAPAERPVTRNRGIPPGKYGPYSQKFTPFKK